NGQALVYCGGRCDVGIHHNGLHKHGLAILEREGFIALDVDPRDTRRRIVSPTDRARRLLSRLSKRVNAWADSLNT
ncbi:MAG: hypothetical protein ACKPBE_02315, partial [Betaproteobacteria bacterium]